MGEQWNGLVRLTCWNVGNEKLWGWIRYDIHGNPGQLNSSNSSEFLNTKNISIFAHIPYLMCNGTALFKCIFVLWVVAVACIAVRMVKTGTCFLLLLLLEESHNSIRAMLVCLFCVQYFHRFPNLFIQFFWRTLAVVASFVFTHNIWIRSAITEWTSLVGVAYTHNFFLPRLADSRLFRVHVLYNICISCLLLYRFIWCI